MITHENIQGWFDFPEFYQRVVDRAKDGDKFIEIGAWFGKSTCFLAQAIQRSGKKIELYVVDTWQGSPNEVDLLNTVQENGGSILPQFLKNMEDAGVQDIIKPIVMTSLEAAESFPDYHFDFIFIDASHDYENVKADINAWLPKANPNGLLAGHDYCTYEDVRKAVHEAFDIIESDGNVWYLGNL